MADVNQKPSLLTFKDKPSLGQACADKVLQVAREAIKTHGKFVVAFSGGSLPKIIAPWLIAAAVKECGGGQKEQLKAFWSKWHVFFADERYVAPDHPDSNYYACKEALFDRAEVFVPPAQIDRIDMKLSLQENAKKAEESLRGACGFPAGQSDAMPVLDLILLGMGPDGHTASLFPSHALLGETKSAITFIQDSPKPPPQRVTMTMPVLCSARHVCFVTAGESKAGAVEDIFKDGGGGGGGGRQQGLPAGRVVGSDVTWYIDESAASRL